MDFRRQVQSERTGGKPPVLVRKDAKRMAEIVLEDKQIAERERTIILPKINKKEQNRERVMGTSRNYGLGPSSTAPSKSIHRSFAAFAQMAQSASRIQAPATPVINKKR